MSFAAASEKNNLATDKKEAEEAIKKWLRRAKERHASEANKK